MSVTIIGLHGALGKPLLAALTSSDFSSKVSRPVVAITRDLSNIEQAKGITYKEAKTAADWDPIFKDTEILINVAAGAINKDIEAAIARNPPKVYVPSEFGVDSVKTAPHIPTWLWTGKVAHAKTVRDQGVKVIEVYTGLFDTPGSWLAEYIQTVGYDDKTGAVSYIGGGDLPFVTTKTEDIGKVLAAIATHADPASLPDTLRVASNVATSEQVIARYEKEHGKQITRAAPQDVAEATKRAKELASDPNADQIKNLLFYLQVIIANNEQWHGLLWDLKEREVINPGETVFKWTAF